MMILKKYLNLANAKELYLKSQLGLVKEIIKASLVRFPFQNITTFGKFLPRERATPSFHQMITAPMRGEGGLCGHLNNYVRFQLDTLGYQTELVAGCFRRTGIPMSHYLVKVKIPPHLNKDGMGHDPMAKREGRTYFIDVGGGIPLHEPICLETLPYRGRAGGLNFRYERVDEHTVQRVNECGDALMGQKAPSFVSPQDYTFDIRPRVYADFKDSVHEVYSNPRSVYLHQGIYCFRYLDIKEDDFEIVCIRGTDLIFITKETRHVQSFGTYENIHSSLLKYFPMIDPEDVALAVKHYSIPFEEALKMSSKSN